MSSVIDIFKNLSENSQDILLIYDVQESAFVHVDEKFAEIVGSSPEKLPDTLADFESLVHPDDRPFIGKKLEELLANGQSVKFEFRLQNNEQVTTWLEVKAYKIQEGDKYFVVGVAEDINLRKEHELNLLTIKEQKNVAIQILAHDLRAPLNTIKMSSGLLEKEISEESEFVEKLLKIINTTCQNSLQMISQVLEIELVEVENVKLQKKREELVARVRNQVEIYKLGERAKLFTVTSSSSTIYARVDMVRFMLIIENLISNAYKFTKSNGHIKVHLEDEKDTVLITVADNGIGIPQKLQPLIFDKFTKARREGVDGSKPVGLGMHLIKKMVDMHDGKIWFESEEGKGTTFYVEVPK